MTIELKPLEGYLSELDENTSNIIRIIIALIIGFYAAFIGSKYELPSFLRSLFENPLFKIAFLSLILLYHPSSGFKGQQNQPFVALAIGIVFVLTLGYLDRMNTKETFEQIERYRHMRKQNRSRF